MLNAVRKTVQVSRQADAAVLDYQKLLILKNALDHVDRAISALTGDAPSFEIKKPKTHTGDVLSHPDMDADVVEFLVASAGHREQLFRDAV